MAKRSSNEWNDKQAEYSVETEAFAGKGERVTTVRLVCVAGVGRYIIDGSVTGTHYEFVGSQALDVDIYDAQEFLAKRRGGCCGNPPSPLFVKV